MKKIIFDKFDFSKLLLLTKLFDNSFKSIFFKLFILLLKFIILLLVPISNFSKISTMKNIVMPPKLNLNLNIGNKLIGINSLEDTSNSKSSLRIPTSKEENKKELININNNINR